MKKSNREIEVLSFIKNFMVSEGYTPTIRQMGRGVGLKSTSSVYMYFRRLIDSGDIVQHGVGYSVKGMKYVKEC